MSPDQGPSPRPGRRGRWLPFGEHARARAGARPDEPADTGLQHERTVLAWERSGIALMVAAALLARYALDDQMKVVAVLAFSAGGVGGAFVLWSGIRYDDLHEPLRAGEPVAHSYQVAILALSSALIAAVGLVLTAWLAIRG